MYAIFRESRIGSENKRKIRAITLSNKTFVSLVFNGSFISNMY